MNRFEQRVRRRVEESPDFAAGLGEGTAEFDLVQQLDRARVERQLSKADLASRMGRERAFVSRKLNHPQNMQLDTLTLFLRSLGKRAEIVISEARTGTPTLRVTSRKSRRRQGTVQTDSSAPSGRAVRPKARQWRRAP